jgi:SAM-dependent methyltransferase
MTDEEATYVRRMLSGAEYVQYINSSEPDVRTREAFQDLVLSIAPAGGTLFDFGAGPGIDARFFAERGLRIASYDVDPRMREFFREYCGDLMESGRITLESGNYREFIAGGGDGSAVDLVVSDFAPLNLVDDLPQLFAKFHALTRPTGKVLASVLKPCFVGEMRYRWWWRHAPELWRRGEYFMPGPQAPHYRRRVMRFREASAPHFRLTRVFQGTPGRRYMFLLFEK